jgi:hypothetical protein
MRKSTLVLTAAAAVLPLTLAACTGGATTAASPTSSTVPSPTASAEPAAKTTTSGACEAKDFKVDLNTQPDGGKAMLTLTNQGKRSCTVQGWPVLSFLAADNSAVRVTQRKVPQPGPGGEIVLKTGQTAFAGVKWTTCDKGDESCAVVATVQVTPPGAKSAVVADFIGANGGDEKVTELPISSVQVGTLQPSHQGVVAW